jgi:hypothetical protein
VELKAVEAAAELKAVELKAVEAAAELKPPEVKTAAGPAEKEQAIPQLRALRILRIRPRDKS